MVKDVLAELGLTDTMLRAYKGTEPNARQEWEDAREQSADEFFNQALETANNAALEPGHARVKVDTLKWAARIRNPRLYGEKQQIDMNIKTVDLTKIISDANARLAAAQAAGRIIEGAVIRPQLEDLM